MRNLVTITITAVTALALAVATATPANALGLAVGPGSNAELSYSLGGLFVADMKVDDMRAGAELQLFNRMGPIGGWTYISATRVWDTNGANGDSPSVHVYSQLSKLGRQATIRVVTWTQKGANGPRVNIKEGPSFQNPFPYGSA